MPFTAPQNMPDVPNVSNVPDVTGLILAGGASSRVHPTTDDKGLLPLFDKPMVSYIFDRLRPQVKTVAISANKNIAQYEAFGVPVWPDIKHEGWEDHPGPLAGIYTGLQHCRTTWLATAPCDSPLLPKNYVAKLYRAAQEHNAKIVIASTGHEGEEKLHPVFALIHHSLKDDLYAYLKGGDRKILLWIKQHPYASLPFDETAAFMTNVNTIDDWVLLQQQLDKESLI